MRITLTLEPGIERMLKLRMRDEGITLKRAVNDPLRAGLAVDERVAQKKRLVVKPYRLGLMPGLDVDKINQSLDEMAVEEFARRFGR